MTIAGAIVAGCHAEALKLNVCVITIPCNFIFTEDLFKPFLQKVVVCMPYIDSSVTIGILIVITAVYAYLDVFNKRNVPNYFVYATLAIGIVVSLLSGVNLEFTYGIAIVIGIAGYLLYRAGLLGGGDVFEFIFICLVMPSWPQALYLNIFQFYLPFVISVLIASGYTSLLFIPIYYVVVKKHAHGLTAPSLKSMKLAAVLFIAYVAFMTILYLSLRIGALGIALLTALAVASFFTIIYEKDIYLGMVSFISPQALEEGDMIAVNLMSKKDFAYFSRYDGFGRLATKTLIAKMRGAKKKLPVYRDSVPFSAFVFIGVIISLAVGNIILLMVS